MVEKAERLIKVYRFRVKNLAGELNRMARAVNFVWNYANNAQQHAVKWGRPWPTSFDLMHLTAGSSEELGIHSGTVAVVCKQYVSSRRQHKRPWLRYRGHKSLGWVPLRGHTVKITGDGIVVAQKTYKVFGARPVEGRILDGSAFSQDARGRWYINLTVEACAARPAPRPFSSVGIDLGLKDLAALSTGEKIGNPRPFAALQERLGNAQRANKRRLAASIHARIANARSDHLHKMSRQIVERFNFIAVGNVSAVRLAKTRMAKSVHDVSWSSFRHMLHYKAIAQGGVYEEVNEAFTTQLCSACGCTTGPKGVAGLGIRAWACVECGSVHDRDTNSAINILLRSGHRALAEGAAV